MSLSPLHKALAVFAASAFFWLAFSLQPDDVIHSLQGSTMGTTWSVQLAQADEEELPELANDVQALLRQLDRETFSTWAVESELSRLNAAPVGHEARVSVAMMEVLQLAKRMHAESRGAFDVSIGPLVELWGFGPQAVAGVPDLAAITAAKARLGLDALVLDTTTGFVRFDKTLGLDLSGIAKGYAVDRVADLLQAAGHESFLVEIGGELRLQGLRPDGEAWTLAIEAPQDGARAVQARISSRGEAIAVAGSGDYRNYREVDGTRYSHEIDPRSGYPVRHELAAVTVIAADAAEADAWATALMVLGPEEGTAIADSVNLAAYFIMRRPSGLAHAETAAFKHYLIEE